MNNYRGLRKRERDNIKSILLNTYGFNVPNEWQFMFLGKGRVWLVPHELRDFDTEKLNVELMGIYFCFYDREILRLSPEGAHIVGKEATKNVLLITEEQAKQTIRGFDLDIETNLDAKYIILKSKKGIIGVGKNHKTKVLCQISKKLRIRSS